MANVGDSSTPPFLAQAAIFYLLFYEYETTQSSLLIPLFFN